MDLRKDPIIREYDAWLDEALRPVREMRARSVAKREAQERAAIKPMKRKAGVSGAQSTTSRKKPAAARASARAKGPAKR